MKAGALIVVAAIACTAGCGGAGGPISRATLEQRLRHRYAQDGHPSAKVECKSTSGKYHCAATLNGIDALGGTVYTTYSLSGHQTGDTTEAIP